MKRFLPITMLAVAILLFCIGFPPPDTAQAQLSNPVTISKNSTATNGALVTLSGAAVLYNANMFNTSGSTVYLMVFDGGTYPTNGTAPVLAPVQVPTLSTAAYTYNAGRRFDNGIILACSSTQGTLTLSTNGWFDCVYTSFH